MRRQASNAGRALLAAVSLAAVATWSEAASAAQPDDGAVQIMPGRYHGNWRLVAADDPHDQALMRLSVLHGRGEASADADYAIFQPFCGLGPSGRVIGDEVCELDGLGGLFETAEATGRRLTLVFRPTADGLAHRLILRRRGDRLTGVYQAPDFARAVVAERVP
ncbi:hypothetical protein ACO2Q1_02160 [Brevundimonas sp. VNH65]|uniref:hypothetical protein n=1 Tax=Brevundimonas sp. VNH65 TaxID=3400917 RepID=UPI003C0C7AB3